jgi:hypothetical protein
MKRKPRGGIFLSSSRRGDEKGFYPFFIPLSFYCCVRVIIINNRKIVAFFRIENMRENASLTRLLF